MRGRSLPILNADGDTMTFYHGTRRPFRRGGLLLPPTYHGGDLTTSPRVTDRALTPWEQDVVDDAVHWVFVTESWEVALTYAHAAPGRGTPKILLVRPDAATLQRDPEHSLDYRAWRCRQADVEHVYIDPPHLIEDDDEEIQTA